MKSFLSTDFAPGMIEIANEKLAAERNSGVAHEGLSFLTADAFDERVQLSDEQGSGYDAILAFNFFHLVENPDDLLARVRDLLKPGGLYISKTVCLKDPCLAVRSHDQGDAALRQGALCEHVLVRGR